MTIRGTCGLGPQFVCQSDKKKTSELKVQRRTLKQNKNRHVKFGGYLSGQKNKDAGSQ